jgi:hypothetical protein
MRWAHNCEAPPFSESLQIQESASGSAVGPVFESLVGPHAHGTAIFVDTAHHGNLHGTAYVYLLDASRFDDDLVPARCERGTHELSRAEMPGAIKAGQHTILLS